MCLLCCGPGPWGSLGSMLVRSMDGCVWRMCFSWARTMLSLADCLEAIKELDRMIVTFLRAWTVVSGECAFLGLVQC